MLCWREEERAPLWGKLHNLSLGGCFVLTRQPFRVGEAVSVVMVLYGTRIRARAEVRVQRPDAGMGLRFVSMAPEDLHSLQTALQRLSIPSSGPTYPRDNKAVVLRQLQSWFQHNPNLSREQFYRLLRRSHPEK